MRFVSRTTLCSALDIMSDALQLSLIEGSSAPPQNSIFKRIHILRHGQAIHNVQRGYPGRDPPLTEQGIAEAAAVKLTSFTPDLIISSPMTRAIQTALTAFGSIVRGPADIPLVIWPDLREAHDAECNKGVSRDRMIRAYPELDFSLCMPEWEYEDHSDEAAFRRAAKVKEDLWNCSAKDIVVVTHRGFIAYLIAEPSSVFKNCEMKSYILTRKKPADYSKTSTKV